MRRTLIVLLLAACGGPSQQKLVETPAATAPFPHYEAPPASTSDLDRERLIQQFDDMRWTQEAYEQADRANEAQPPPSAQPAPPKKRGPAEQATMPPRTKAR